MCECVCVRCLSAEQWTCSQGIATQYMYKICSARASRKRHLCCRAALCQNIKRDATSDLCGGAHEMCKSKSARRHARAGDNRLCAKIIACGVWRWRFGRTASAMQCTHAENIHKFTASGCGGGAIIDSIYLSNICVLWVCVCVYSYVVADEEEHPNKNCIGVRVYICWHRANTHIMRRGNSITRLVTCSLRLVGVCVSFLLPRARPTEVGFCRCEFRVFLFARLPSLSLSVSVSAQLPAG